MLVIGSLQVDLIEEPRMGAIFVDITSGHHSDAKYCTPMVFDPDARIEVSAVISHVF
jgi:hypothetical protein